MPTDSAPRGSRSKWVSGLSAQALYRMLWATGTALVFLSLLLSLVGFVAGVQVLQRISKGIFVFGALVFVMWGIFLVIFRPAALFGYAIGKLFAWAYILFRKIPMNKPAKRVIVLGGAYPTLYPLYGSPDYDIDLFLLVRLLEVKGGDISIWLCKTKEDVITALTAPSVEEVYFLGHGSDHSFQLGPSQLFYYCELSSVNLPKDLHMYLLHCGGKGGKTACDYVGDSIAECVRIGQDEINNLETAQWIIERLVVCADHKTLARLLYYSITGIGFVFAAVGVCVLLWLFTRMLPGSP